MRLLLCSDFSGVGYRYLKNFKENLEGKTCLFIGYAQEDEFEEESSAAEKLRELGLKLEFLKKDYNFNKKIDVVFARGGNTTRLLHYLHEYNQYEKLKELIENNVIYIGNSAGSIIVGTDTQWTLESEPYEVDIQEKFGKDALKGYGFIDKLIFVHCSRYRIAWSFEREMFNGEVFRTLDRECYPAYLNDLKKYKKDEFIRIGNNEVYFVDGYTRKIITYNWSHIPVRILD